MPELIQHAVRRFFYCPGCGCRKRYDDLVCPTCWSVIDPDTKKAVIDMQNWLYVQRDPTPDEEERRDGLRQRVIKQARERNRIN